MNNFRINNFARKSKRINVGTSLKCSEVGDRGWELLVNNEIITSTILTSTDFCNQENLGGEEQKMALKASETPKWLQKCWIVCKWLLKYAKQAITKSLSEIITFKFAETVRAAQKPCQHRPSPETVSKSAAFKRLVDTNRDFCTAWDH